MKNKKGSMIGMVGGLIILGILILLMITSGNQLFASTSDSLDDNILSHLSQFSNSENNSEDRLENLKDAALYGDLTDAQLKYGSDLTKHLFDFSNSESTNGDLVTFFTPSNTVIDANSALFIHSSSNGVLAGYNIQEDEQIFKLVSSKNDNFGFLRGTEICILTFDDDHNIDAKKTLSYATGFKQKGIDTLPTIEDVKDIMASNVVEQVSFSKNRLRYFKGTKLDSIKIKDSEKILAYNLNGITCIFPAKSWPYSHVRLSIGNSVPVFKGSGQIYTGLVDLLLLRIPTIKQGDFS